MSLFANVQLPDNAEAAAVRGYLEAQHRKDFSGADQFFADDVAFNGLILRASGRETVAQEMQGFISAMIDYIELEAVAQVEDGDRPRFLAMYWFKLKPVDQPQMLCDHITLQGGKIVQIDNVFDVKKVPAM